MKFIRLHSSTLESVGNRGFTLVELMITVAISGIVMGSLGAAYIAQQRNATAQEQVVEMQQNIRAGLDILEREIRMAGYDPSHKAGATITAATNNSLSFTMDLNGDNDVGDTGENLTYSLYTSGGIQKLGRTDNTGGLGILAVAENIQAIEFNYTMADSTTTTAPAPPLSNIRAVQISILARASGPDSNFTNTAIYNAPSGTTWGSYNDNLRRRLLISTIQCRNMGL